MIHCTINGEVGYPSTSDKIKLTYNKLQLTKWQSDVDAARVVASAVVARLHANKEFQKCLEAAKKEFAKLVKQGKVKKSEFVATPWDKK